MIKGWSISILLNAGTAMGLTSMLGIFQSDMDTYNERVGQVIGWIVGVLLLIIAIVWLVKRVRK